VQSAVVPLALAVQVSLLGRHGTDMQAAGPYTSPPFLSTCDMFVGGRFKKVLYALELKSGVLLVV